jgi:hypothetical protein
MATLQEMVFNIRNSPNRGKATRATAYSNRQIAFWIRAVRNFLITKDVEKNRSIHVAYEQDLGCVPLTKVDQADCPQALWGKVVRKCVIPEILEIQHNAGLAFFGLIDKRTRIYIPSTQFGSLDDFIPFRKKNQDYMGYMIGNTIYVYGNDPKVEKLEWCNVRGIFKDPTLVTTCAQAGIAPVCYDPETDCYPVPGDLEQTLYDLVFEKYILKFANAPEDTENN